MKRLIFVFCLILTAFQPVMATGQTEVQASPLPAVLRLGAIKGPSGIGLVHLLETPPVLPGGDTVSVELVGSADAIASKLLSGELDAAVLPVNLAAKLYNSGIDYRLAAVVGNGMIKVITTDPTIVGITDLSQRSVHVAGQASTPEFLLRAILEHSKLTGEAAPTLVFNLPIPEIAASMIAGRINLAVVPEPFATMILAGNPEAREAFSLGQLWQEATGLADYPMTAFVVKVDTADQRPATVQALMAAYRDSITRMLANPQEAGVLAEKFEIGLKAAIAAKAIPQSNYVFLDAPASRPMVEGLLNVFLASAPVSVGGKLPAESFYADFGQSR
ncbi:MAG: MqnA/MqnD/SBP family protein [Spirochaetia bacterium]|nr:MqnA/MqnD/SBP family protein [Spirochaetia bacterium]